MMDGKIIAIPTLVPRVEIIYDFVSPQEEAFLIEHINHVGGDSTANHNGNGNSDRKTWGWKTLNGRRSMVWGGTILSNSHHLIPTPFPKFMDGTWPDILDRIAQTGVYDEWTSDSSQGRANKGKERGPNHCLVNEYLPSQGILPHTDGPAYRPCTTTLSLGSHTILSLRSNPLSSTPSSASSPTTPSSLLPTSGQTTTRAPCPPGQLNQEIDKIEILLPPRSLLILSSTLYRDYLHGIQPLPVSPVASLEKCLNWDSWWQHLLSKRGEKRLEELEGLFVCHPSEVEEEKTGEGLEKEETRREAFGQLKKGLKELNLLNESEEVDEVRDTTTGTIRDVEEPTGAVTQKDKTEGSGADEFGDAEWKTRVKKRKMEIENSEGPDFVNGWKRGKRISLTCRRNAGKVKDLGGLLSRVGGKK